MKVFTLGRSVISTAAHVIRLENILRLHSGEKLVLVIAALGKTTCQLEEVAEAFYAGRKDDAIGLFDQVRQDHITLAAQLLKKNYAETLDQLNGFFTEAEWQLHDKPVRTYNYYYDQIVCLGELLSSCIISAYLTEVGIGNFWADVRDLVRTDNHFREALPDWQVTKIAIENLVLPVFDTTDVFITQGGIGATDENESTTLGRGGGDYTGAIFANLLNASGLTLWRDTAGIMSTVSGDVTDPVFIPELHYADLMEMAYYGEAVMHPRGIKPVQDKNIPLAVRSLLHDEEPGSLIHDKHVKQVAPIILLREDLVLIKMQTADGSFIAEHAPLFYQALEKKQMMPLLIFQGATGIECCVDHPGERIDDLAISLAATFTVELEKGLKLLTIKRYTEELLHRLTTGRQVVLKVQTPDWVQVLMRE